MAVTERSYGFVKALEFTLPWECGKKKDGSLDDVVHYRDGGLPTKFGIWQGAHPDIDVANLTLPDAIELYRKDYWVKYTTHGTISANLDNLPVSLAVAVFDSGVNCGVGNAIKWLGVALEQKNPTRSVCDQRGVYYSKLVTQNKTKYGPNYKGWMNRLNDLRKYCDILEADQQQSYSILDKVKEKGLIELFTKPK